jgi:hypothetical protein
LTIDADVYDNHKLVSEMMSLPLADKHKKFRDDLADALRYCVAMVPWDYAAISPTEFKDEVHVDPYKVAVPDQKWTAKEHLQWEINRRRGLTAPESQESEDERAFHAEIDYWNDAYGG